MDNIFLLTGSNIGKREYFLDFALFELSKHLEIISKSSVYESEPWGFESDMPFLNQCVGAESEMSPQELLEIIKKIEKSAGRIKRSEEYEDRPLDIDILFYGDLIMDTENLTIPHPRLHLRAFSLVPLLEIAADFTHPVFKKTPAELLKECPDRNMPRKL